MAVDGAPSETTGFFEFRLAAAAASKSSTAQAAPSHTPNPEALPSSRQALEPSIASAAPAQSSPPIRDDLAPASALPRPKRVARVPLFVAGVALLIGAMWVARQFNQSGGGGPDPASAAPGEARLLLTDEATEAVLEQAIASDTPTTSTSVPTSTVAPTPTALDATERVIAVVALETATATPTAPRTATSRATSTSAPEATPTEPTSAAGTRLLGEGVEALFEDTFVADEISADWDVWNNEPTLTDGELVFVGDNTWNNAIARGDIDRNKRVLVLFSFDDALRMEFNLQRGDFDEESLRNWTFTRWETFVAAAYYGAEATNHEVYATPYLEPGKWYYLLMRVGAAGTFHTQVWERDNPAFFLADVTAQPPENGWDADDWEFVVHVHSGTLRLDSVRILRFPARYATLDTPPNLAGVPAASAERATENAASTQAAVDRPDVLAFCADADGGNAPPSDLQSGQSIDLFWFWSAATPELLQDHIDSAVYEVRVDDQPIADWMDFREPVFRIVDGDYYQYWSVPIGPLSDGQHEITFQVTWSAPVTDGYSDYGPGSNTPEWLSGCTITVN